MKLISATISCLAVASAAPTEQKAVENSSIAAEPLNQKTFLSNVVDDIVQNWNQQKQAYQTAYESKFADVQARAELIINDAKASFEEKKVEINQMLNENAEKYGLDQAKMQAQFERNFDDLELAALDASNTGLEQFNTFNVDASFDEAEAKVQARLDDALEKAKELQAYKDLLKMQEELNEYAENFDFEAANLVDSALKEAEKKGLSVENVKNLVNSYVDAAFGLMEVEGESEEQVVELVEVVEPVEELLISEMVVEEAH